VEEALDYFPDYRDRACEATAYAEDRGLRVCWWWLRTPGESQENAVSINKNGSWDEVGSNVYTSKGGVRPLTLRISDLDRAAPRGTGHIKAGLNYAMSLYNIVDAHEQGYDENVYVDAATRTFIEETGGANIIFVTPEGKLVVPKSDTILPSITRRSLVQVAKDYLGIEVEERPVALSELSSFAECGLCGTAAVISPVGKIVDHGKEVEFAGMGPVIRKLYDTLTGMQMGSIEAPEGWIFKIC
jgi:branched-chain amino acid aminotransferase